jgi:magnesium transporter
MMQTDLELARAFMESHPEEAALSMERMPHDDAAALLREVPVDTAAGVIVRMVPEPAVECLLRLRADLAGELLAAMPRDHSALVLRRMRVEDRDRLLKAAPESVSSALGLLLRFPENTAGALMDPAVLSLPQEITVGEALDYVRRPRTRISYYVYILDRDRKLAGVLNLRELVEAAEDKLLEDIMHRHVVRLPVNADPIAMRAHPGWLDYYALPVVDKKGVLVGLLRYKIFRAAFPEDTRVAGAPDPLAASLEIGELYWSTLGQLLQTIWPAARPNTTRKSEEPDGR